MFINKIQGLIYPDEFIIKFFFKKKLNENPGRVLELGCGNGNNLMHFYAHGWEVTGVDCCEKSLADAATNLPIAHPGGSRKTLVHVNLEEGLPESIRSSSTKYDVVLLPSVLYYLSRTSMELILGQLRPLMADGSWVYLRNRTLKDHRYARGKLVERNGYVLDIRHTGEFDLLNVFYTESEIVDMMVAHGLLERDTCELLSVEFQNIQNEVKVFNSDIVIWGKVPR